jgi:hypothetical protein
VRIGVRIDAMTATAPNCVRYRLAMFAYTLNRGQRQMARDETATAFATDVAFCAQKPADRAGGQRRLWTRFETTNRASLEGHRDVCGIYGSCQNKMNAEYLPGGSSSAALV